MRTGFVRRLLSAYVYNLILHSCSARSARFIHFLSLTWRIRYIRISFRLRLLFKIARELSRATYSWSARRPLDVVAYRFPEHAFELSDGTSDGVDRPSSLRHSIFESFGVYLSRSGYNSAVTVETYRARATECSPRSGLTREAATKGPGLKSFLLSLFSAKYELKLPQRKFTKIVSSLFYTLYFVRAARHMKFIRQIDHDGGKLFYLNSTALDFGHLYLCPRYSRIFINFGYSINWDGGLTKLGSTLTSSRFASESEQTLRETFSVECYGAIGASAGYGGNYAVANLIRALVMPTTHAEPDAEPTFIDSTPTMLGFVSERTGQNMAPKGKNEPLLSLPKPQKKLLFIDPSIYSPTLMADYTPVPNDSYREERVESIYSALLICLEKLDLYLEIRPKYSIYRYKNHQIYRNLGDHSRVKFLNPLEGLQNTTGQGYLVALQLPFSSTKSVLEGVGLKSLYLIDDTVDKSSLEYLDHADYVHVNELTTYLSGIL